MYPLLAGLCDRRSLSFVASPTAGLYCAQMGAEVIRVDQIGRRARLRPLHAHGEGRSLSWENLNRAKKSRRARPESPRGRELLVELVRKTGQIDHQPAGRRASSATRGGRTAPRPGLCADHGLARRAPGDGLHGQRRERLSADDRPGRVGQATAPPVNQVLPAWDFITGAYCAFALLAGLRHRDATGEGSELRVPLGDVAIGTMANSGAMAEMLYRGADRAAARQRDLGRVRARLRQQGRQALHGRGADAPSSGVRMIEAFGVAGEIAALEARLGVDFASGDRPVSRTAMHCSTCSSGRRPLRLRRSRRRD